MMCCNFRRRSKKQVHARRLTPGGFSCDREDESQRYALSGWRSCLSSSGFHGRLALRAPFIIRPAVLRDVGLCGQARARPRSYRAPLADVPRSASGRAIPAHRRLKLIFSVTEVAGYKAKGQVTRERRKKPFQLARGAMRYSKNARRNSRFKLNP
jgi:hypothetical protein